MGHKYKRPYPNRLAELMEEWNGVTQADIAEVCGVAQSAVSKWSRNELQLPVGAAVLIGEHMGIEPSYVLGISDLRCDPTATAKAVGDVEGAISILKSAVAELENALWL